MILRCGVTSLLACCLLSGCTVRNQLYSGHRLPREKVAWIDTRKGNSACAALKTFDGLPTNTFFCDVWEFLPAEHTIGVEVIWSNRFRELVQLKFVSTPNATYCLNSHESEWPPTPPGKPPTPLQVGSMLAVGLPVLFVIEFFGPVLLPFALIGEFSTAPPSGPPPGTAVDVSLVDQNGSEVAHWHRHVEPVAKPK